MSIAKLVFVKGIVPSLLTWVKEKVRELGLDEDKNVRLDEKSGETSLSCNVEGNRIVPVVTGFVPQFIKFFVPCFKGSAVIRVTYKDKSGKDQVKLIKPEREGKNFLFFRNGEVMNLWDGFLEICYLGARSAMENGKKVWYTVYDDIFSLAIPDHVKSSGDEAMRSFVKKNGLPGRFHEALDSLSINIKMEHREKKAPNNGVDISGKSKDGLPGIVVAKSEPGDENSEEPKDNANSGANATDVVNQNANQVDKDKGKPNGSHKNDNSRKGKGKSSGKPGNKAKSDKQILANLKAGVPADIAAE
jgi:hypothetical protein